MVEIWGALMGCAWIKGNRVDLIRKAVLSVHFMTAFYVVFCVGELLDTRIMRSLIMSPYLIACVRTFCKVDGVIVDQGKCIRDFSDRRMKVLGKIFDIIFFALHLFLVAFFLKRGGDSDSLGAVLQLLYMIAHSAVHCWLGFRNFVT